MPTYLRLKTLKSRLEAKIKTCEKSNITIGNSTITKPTLLPSVQNNKSKAINRTDTEEEELLAINKIEERDNREQHSQKQHPHVVRDGNFDLGGFTQDLPETSFMNKTVASSSSNGDRVNLAMANFYSNGQNDGLTGL